MSLMSVLLTIGAIALTYRIFRVAVRRPRVYIFLLCGLLMCAPVTLLQAAHLTRFVTVLPFLLLLGLSGWTCAVGAFDRYTEIRSAPNEMDSTRRTTGWWNAPTISDQSVEGDVTASDAGPDVSDDAQFDDLIRRNFTVPE